MGRREPGIESPMMRSFWSQAPRRDAIDAHSGSGVQNLVQHSPRVQTILFNRADVADVLFSALQLRF